MSRACARASAPARRIEPFVGRQQQRLRLPGSAVSAVAAGADDAAGRGEQPSGRAGSVRSRSARLSRRSGIASRARPVSTRLSPRTCSSAATIGCVSGSTPPRSASASRAEGLGLDRLAPGAQDTREGVQGARRVRVLGAERRPAQRQRLAIERLGALEVAPRLDHVGERRERRRPDFGARGPLRPAGIDLRAIPRCRGCGARPGRRAGPDATPRSVERDGERDAVVPLRAPCARGCRPRGGRPRPSSRRPRFIERRWRRSSAGR